jgi:hypothetical protein
VTSLARSPGPVATRGDTLRRCGQDLWCGSAWPR